MLPVYLFRCSWPSWWGAQLACVMAVACLAVALQRSGVFKTEADEDATAVGLVTHAWAGLLKQQGRRPHGSFPVEKLLEAMALQSKAGLTLGPFMVLIAKCDDANMRTIRTWWEKHSRPSSLRALAEAEKRYGIQQAPKQLVESASLALLWATRMQAFWLGILRVLADGGMAKVHMPSHATSIYRSTVEPYHGILLRGVFKTALQALPSRSEMLRRLALGSNTDGTPPPEQLAKLGRELRRCADVTARTVAVLRGMLADLSLTDEQKV